MDEYRVPYLIQAQQEAEEAFIAQKQENTGE